MQLEPKVLENRFLRLEPMGEMHREDLRQLTAVSARFAGIDMGHGITAIKAKLDKSLQLPPGATLEYGGLYQQQQESFRKRRLAPASLARFASRMCR